MEKGAPPSCFVKVRSCRWFEEVHASLLFTFGELHPVVQDKSRVTLAEYVLIVPKARGSFLLKTRVYKGTLGILNMDDDG